MVESCADVTHRQPRAIHDCILVLCHPGLHGGVTVERGEELITRRHIRCHLLNFQVIHALAMHGIPNVCIMAYPAILRRPVFLPRRYDVEDVGSRVVVIAIGRHPHRCVVVVGCLRNKRCLLILARSIVIIRRTRCKRGRTTKQGYCRHHHHDYGKDIFLNYIYRYFMPVFFCHKIKLSFITLFNSFGKSTKFSTNLQTFWRLLS